MSNFISQSLEAGDRYREQFLAAAHVQEENFKEYGDVGDATIGLGARTAATPYVGPLVGGFVGIVAADISKTFSLGEKACAAIGRVFGGMTEWVASGCPDPVDPYDAIKGYPTLGE